MLVCFINHKWDAKFIQHFNLFQTFLEFFFLETLEILNLSKANSQYISISFFICIMELSKHTPKYILN